MDVRVTDSSGNHTVVRFGTVCLVHRVGFKGDGIDSHLHVELTRSNLREDTGYDVVVGFHALLLEALVGECGVLSGVVTSHLIDDRNGPCEAMLIFPEGAHEVGHLAIHPLTERGPVVVLKAPVPILVFGSDLVTETGCSSTSSGLVQASHVVTGMLTEEGACLHTDQFLTGLFTHGVSDTLLELTLTLFSLETVSLLLEDTGETGHPLLESLLTAAISRRGVEVVEYLSEAAGCTTGVDFGCYPRVARCHGLLHFCSDDGCQNLCDITHAEAGRCHTVDATLCT
ncbi:hypothetical protein XMV242_002324 [Marinobacterium sp. xm-v-242]|nr:hypothetical protein [Marinobacterium sp. xm-v-242]NRP84120.1 hypothetical protein [Marinobacterium sp. xm-d-509]